MRTSRLFLHAGLLLGALIAVLSMVVPNAGLHWLIHTPAGRVGLPLTLALIATGAVLGRLDRAESAAAAGRDDTRAELDRLVPDATAPTEIANHEGDRAL